MELKLEKLKIEERLEKEKYTIIEEDDSEKKDILIEVEFKGSRKEYFLNPKSVPLSVGGFTIIEYDNGEDMGVVSAFINKKLKGIDYEVSGRIIRKCNNIDIRRLKENRKIEDEILINARHQAKKHGLEMKFIDIEYKFDRKKLVFFFTADGRVDFRELVKTFAGQYKTRIELRQIGVRDEAQRIGGVGICGFELCCSKFLKNFVSINVSMARDQNLFVKPEKFSGACGKLMCCLKYEHDFYLDVKKGVPEVGTSLKLDKGLALISNIDVFAQKVTLNYRTGETENISIPDFLEIYSDLTPDKLIKPFSRNFNDNENHHNQNNISSKSENLDVAKTEQEKIASDENNNSRTPVSVVERIVKQKENNKEKDLDQKINVKVPENKDKSSFINELNKLHNEESQQEAPAQKTKKVYRSNRSNRSSENRNNGGESRKNLKNNDSKNGEKRGKKPYRKTRQDNGEGGNPGNKQRSNGHKSARKQVKKADHNG